MIQKNKIVATIGPATNSPDILKKMFSAGMSIARLNGSHNTLDWHRKTIKLIKKTIPECPIDWQTQRQVQARSSIPEKSLWDQGSHLNTQTQARSRSIDRVCPATVCGAMQSYCSSSEDRGSCCLACCPSSAGGSIACSIFCRCR